MVISDVSWTYETHYPHALAANVSPKFYSRCFVQYENFLFSPFLLSIQWICILSIYYKPGSGDPKIYKMFPFVPKPSGPLWSARKYRQTDYSKTVQCVTCDIWGRKMKVLMESQVSLQTGEFWPRPWMKSSYSMGRGSTGNFRWKINRSNTSKHRRVWCVWGAMKSFAWTNNRVSEGVNNGMKWKLKSYCEDSNIIFYSIVNRVYLKLSKIKGISDFSFF